ncbi:hypothetical protein BH09PSE5_BH09PSE5_31680 [soil metagenome]
MRGRMTSRQASLPMKLGASDVDANRPRSLGWLKTITIAAAALSSASAAQAAIYTCVAPDGRKLTSDRTIPECASREQQIRNPDGSVRSIVPPNMTSDERNEAEALERRRAAERAALADAVRRDRSLVSRYPNEAAHMRARETALDDVRSAVKVSEQRDAALAKERKPLLDEAEFYKGKPLPAKLREQLDANDAAVDAQRSLAQNQSAERDRINALFDAELVRLRRLWAGAAPGSLGPLNTDPAPSAAPSAGNATRRSP